MAQKRIPVLETFSWQPPVTNVLSTPPASPALGDRYIVGADPVPTGAWVGKANNIATWSPGSPNFWLFDIPSQAWEVANITQNKVYFYDDGEWKSRPAYGEFIFKRASSTIGKIPTWQTITGDELNDGHTFRTAIRTTGTADDASIPSEKAVRDAIEAVLGANDAMVFKGTVGTGGTLTTAAFNALTTYNTGWTYKVVTAGTHRGKVTEIGDMIVAIVTRTGSGSVDADWTVTQTNIDGAVTGPASAVDDRIATFDGTTGKVIQDSGLGVATVTDHIDDDTLHFTQGEIDHVNLLNIGTNTHAQIDTHIADAAKHREMTYSATLKSIIYTE